MKDYIKWLRTKVGHEKILLNFVGGILVDKQQEILLQKRGDKKTWGLLGGAMELGESASESLIREFKEEANIDINPKELLGVYTNYIDSYPNGDIAQTITILYLVELSSEGINLEYTNDETLELKFFSFQELKKIPIVNKQHEDMLNDYFKGNFRLIR
ncbi:NUDIX hydrolase [Marinilactibacillus psychrotolerans]|uniref:NUDIX hydrolase n=1 Tax=Marinilactibacillus psychrotolerans TaxID=191770 RepID=UPI00388AF48F